MPDAPTRDQQAAAFETVEGVRNSALLLLCDHASNTLPPGLGTLGLPPDRLTEHIAWDIGAAAVTRCLAQKLDAPAILSGYSRLYIDCNRALGTTNSIPKDSDGVNVPANNEISVAERERRAKTGYYPYHRELTRRLDILGEPFIVAMHSCTPVFAGKARPWHVGVLWRADEVSARVLIAALQREKTLCVGENEPYSAQDTPGYTVADVLEPRGLSHVIIEIRQDLIAAKEGVAEWSERLADIFIRDFGMARLTL